MVQAELLAETRQTLRSAPLSPVAADKLMVNVTPVQVALPVPTMTEYLPAPVAVSAGGVDECGAVASVGTTGQACAPRL